MLGDSIGYGGGTARRGESNTGSGGGWTHAEFALDPPSLIALTGDVQTLLANVTALRILHSPDAAFAGESLA